jgi:hypothetical protein
MPITVTPQPATSSINSEYGIFTRKIRLNVSGLTTPGANTIPHGLTSSTGAPVAPQRVIPLPYNATVQGALTTVTLDGTNGGSVPGGGALGFDTVNIYVIASSGATQAAFEIDGY